MLGLMVRRHPLAATGLSVVIVATLALAACSSDSSKLAAKANSPTSTTTRPRHGSSTISSVSGATSMPANSSAIAPPTSAATAPPGTSAGCGAQAGAIDAAIQGGHLGPVPIAKYAISDCRIAASNQIFSAVTLVPNPGSGVVQLTVALKRIGSIWAVQAYGQTHVSCNAPPPVPVELRLGC